MSYKTKSNFCAFVFSFATSCFSFGQTFAVIGDYGNDSPNESAVASMVRGWNPEFIITVGDNNYPIGAASTIDINIGKYYHDYIFPYTGAYGSGADSNKFFPSLGNHDWATAGAAPYLSYFTLPGNERYYDYVRGNIHFFAIDSDSNEPDGRDSNSTQALWLKSKLTISDSPWNIVYFHHPPYCSDATHGSDVTMQWPFKSWGADVVLTGHSHVYERLEIDSFPYFVNGLGGRSIYNFKSIPVPGSKIRYNSQYGAIKAVAWEDSLNFKFISVGGDTIDSYTLKKQNGPPSPKPENKEALPFFQIDPNPVTSYFNVKVFANETIEGKFMIYDALGKEVRREIRNFPVGESSFIMDLSSMSRGVYISKMIVGEKSFEKEIVVLK